MASILTQTASSVSPADSGKEKVASHCEFLNILLNTFKNPQWLARKQVRIESMAYHHLQKLGGIPAYKALSPLSMLERFWLICVH